MGRGLHERQPGAWPKVLSADNRGGPGLEADHSLTGERVARVLERLQAKGECPEVIRTDNGPEFTGKALDRWAQAAGVELEFTRPGKPMDNGHVESFWQVPRRVPGRPDVLLHGGGKEGH